MVRQIGIEPDTAKRIRARQGKTIRQLRKMRDLSIDEFAERVGVTPGAVSQWETGRFSPRQKWQIEIARVLDVPWSSIFAIDGEVA